ncbi:hypothetical protein K443DRAFT_409698 [Laccaria amethystina LaAM-08-1]|uniref:Uncharacterized protein n=1 Tax=Laccaria amethystina LaAM-08-1 TaxID=1095629 RepID=A0A0C9Y384_9AGAR|nr:hypothetical protein K443DRAFT_409698 [Laccaria amethystina LaAM-08-1]
MTISVPIPFFSGIPNLFSFPSPSLVHLFLCDKVDPVIHVIDHGHDQCVTDQTIAGCWCIDTGRRKREVLVPFGFLNHSGKHVSVPLLYPLTLFLRSYRLLLDLWDFIQEDTSLRRYHH